MRDHAPAYFEPDVDELGGIWGLTRHADIMHASKHPELFSSGKSSRPEPGSWIPSMINLDDPLHKRRRNLVNRGFTVRRVADHEEKLRALCDELIDAVSERGECDFVADIARWVPMVVIGDMLGVAPEDRGMLLRWSDEMLGGGDAAVIADPSRIAGAVEEMLRWVSPIQNMNRTLTRDVELHGEKLREGERVLLLYPAGNRDERQFPDPDRFDVARTPNDHVAFGGFGSHFCLGASLARLELRVLFERVLARLPDIELASDDLPLRPSNFIVGIEKMPVRFTPQAPRSGPDQGG